MRGLAAVDEHRLVADCDFIAGQGGDPPEGELAFATTWIAQPEGDGIADGQAGEARTVIGSEAFVDVELIDIVVLGLDAQARATRDDGDQGDDRRQG
jgi:hypothetical protein